MAFRIGQKHAQHAYPEARTATAVALARNSASGPTANNNIAGFFQVTWAVIESGAGAGFNVPITPKSTGIIHVTGVITVASNGGAATIGLLVWAVAAPVPVPAAEAVRVAASAVVAIPFDVILGAGANTPARAIGVPVFIRIQLTTTAPGSIRVVAGSSTISLREVMPVTG